MTFKIGDKLIFTDSAYNLSDSLELGKIYTVRSAQRVLYTSYVEFDELKYKLYDSKFFGFVPETPKQETTMTHYLNSDEARKLTADAKTLAGEYRKEETLAILKSIRDAALAGRNSILVLKKNDKVIIDRLKELGYTVGFARDQRDGDSFEVFW